MHVLKHVRHCRIGRIHRIFLSVYAVLLHWTARPPYDVSQKSNLGICAEPHIVALLPLFSTGKACLHIWQDIPETFEQSSVVRHHTSVRLSH